MGYDGLLGVSTQLKNAYSRIIHPFDTFVAQVRGKALTSPAIQKYATRSSANSPLRTARPGAASRPPNSTASTSSTRLTNGHLNGNAPPVNGNSKHRSPSPSSSSSVSSLSSKEDGGMGQSHAEGPESIKSANSSLQGSTPPPSTTPNKSGGKSHLLHVLLLLIRSYEVPNVKPEYAVPQLDESLRGEVRRMRLWA